MQRILTDTTKCAIRAEAKYILVVRKLRSMAPGLGEAALASRVGHILTLVGHRQQAIHMLALQNVHVVKQRQYMS